MATTDNNSKEIRKRVIRLHKEGWYPYNIAHITRLKTGVVEQILRDNGFLM